MHHYPNAILYIAQRLSHKVIKTCEHNFIPRQAFLHSFGGSTPNAQSTTRTRDLLSSPPSRSSIQDVVGEVETFNYPRFVMEGFHFLGTSESSLSATDGDGGFSETMGGAVRMYTMQARCVAWCRVYLHGLWIGNVQTIGTSHPRNF